jgi:hypothetical protein
MSEPLLDQLLARLQGMSEAQLAALEGLVKKGP